MDEINNKPRRNRYTFLWVLGVIVFLTLAVWVYTITDKTNSFAENTYQNSGSGTAGGIAERSMWANIDLTAPRVRRPEIKSYSNYFTTRGNEKLTIYSLGENILFEPEKATLTSKAEKHLKEIATSIDKRHDDGLIRIFGHADATASEGYNKQLSEERAGALKEWLQENGNIDASRISIEPLGESQHVVSKQTKSGRLQHRRMEIVAVSAEKIMQQNEKD